MTRTGLPAVLLFAATLLGPVGCSYRVVDPSVAEGRSFLVPTAVNDTRWRGVEGTITAALRADLQRLLDVRLVNGQAEWVLRTEVRELYRGAPVRAQSGGAQLGTTTLEVFWTLEDSAGALIDRGRQRQILEFLPSEDEDAYTAIGEIVDSMAEAIVIEVSARLSKASDGTAND